MSRPIITLKKNQKPKKFLPLSEALKAGHQYCVMRVSNSGRNMSLTAVHELEEDAVSEAKRLSELQDSIYVTLCVLKRFN
jgi:hypothetical protein